MSARHSNKNENVRWTDAKCECSVCNELLTSNEFHNWKHERRCKKCISNIRRDKYKLDPLKERARANKYRKLNPDKVKNTKLMQDRGISFETYTQMLNSQNGVCAICKKSESTIWRGKILSLAVDHDHSNNAVRGLLCLKCNRGLGLLEDNIETLQRAIAYLKKHQK